MLSKQEMQNLRLGAYSYWLSQVSKENGVDGKVMGFLASVIRKKKGDIDTISQEELKDSRFSKYYSKDDLLNHGLVTEKGNDLVLTEKAVAILKRASEFEEEIKVDTEALDENLWCF